MTVIDTEIAGVKIIQPQIHRDQRGYFFETYNLERYRNCCIEWPDFGGEFILSEKDKKHPLLKDIEPWEA